MRPRTLPRTEFGDPILTRPSKRVTNTYRRTPEFAQLIKDMVHTMRAVGGVGLAAPQVNVPLRLAVIEARPTENRPEAAALPLLVAINPRILSYHGAERPKWEACLSFNQIFCRVPRYSGVTFEYEDAEGKRHTKKVSGLLAHIVQHEVDHLNGIRYTDRVENTASFMTVGEYRKFQAKRRGR